MGSSTVGPTYIIYHRADQGWRGGVQLDVKLRGTPAKLLVTGDSSIQDFRRYDITSGQPLTLVAHCDGSYSSLDREFHEVGCTAPVGNGRIVLKGELGLPGSRIYNLALTASDIPAAAAVALAQRAKKNLHAGSYRRTEPCVGRSRLTGDAASALRVDGKGEIDGFRLASAANQAEIGPETIPFAWKNGASRRSAELKGMPPMVRSPPACTSSSDPFLPVHTLCPRLFGDGSLAAHTASRSPRMLKLAMFCAWRICWDSGLTDSAGGHGAPRPPSRRIVGRRRRCCGILRAAGNRHCEASQRPARDQGRGRTCSKSTLPTYSSLRTRCVIGKLSATAAGTSWTGSVEMPRGCGAPGACQIHFNLAANRIRTARLAEWSQPRAKEQPWYRVLEPSGSTAPSFLASVRASGHVTAGRLQVRGFAPRNLSADVTLDRAKIRIAQLSANFLGGKQRGTWQADFSVKPAACHGTGIPHRMFPWRSSPALPRARGSPDLRPEATK